MKRSKAVPSIRLPDAADADPIARLVERAHRLLIKHPVAAQAAYRALVAEGARFAGTDEGKTWLARVEHSEQLRRLRPLWEAATLNLLDARSPSALPGQFIELVAHAIGQANIERRLGALTTAMNPRGEGEVR